MNRRPIKIRIQSSHAVIFVAILVQSVLIGDTPPPAPYNFPSKQQILAFLVETIDWYHRLSLQQQIATEPADMLFLEENRPISSQIVRFSFDFARAAAAFEGTASVPAGPKGEHSRAASSPDFQRLIEMETKSESEAQQAGNDLKSLQQKHLASRGADRHKLEVEIADAQSRLELLQAISESYRNLLDFIRETNAGRTQVSDLEASVENLERTVPEASSSASSASPIIPSRSLSSTVFKRAPSGIIGQISDVSSLAQKLRSLDEVIGLTDKLAQSSQNLQTPLAEPLNQAFHNPDLLAGAIKSNDIDTLQQQEARLKALTVETAKISPAVAALDKQRVLLTVYRSHLTDWRASTASQYSAAWENVIIRLVILGAAIALLLGAAAVSRRLTNLHIHDPNRRHMMLVGQRVLFWLTIALIVSFTFAFDLSSVATFLGLVSAGIAVAMQNVILAVVAYFLLVGKLHIRVGDRVQISGVTGEVVDIGLLQFRLKELDTPSEQPTGRVVSFSNSFVFLSPATGLFKRIHGSDSAGWGR